jgi:hypothetical protein
MEDLILSKNEKQIFNLLSFISQNHIQYEYRVEEPRPNIFKTSNYSLTSLWSDNREKHHLTIDYNIKNITVYAYDESRHNGDHYNDHSYNISWDKLNEILPSVKHIASIAVEHHLKNAAEKQFKEAVSLKLNDIINK